MMDKSKKEQSTNLDQYRDLIVEIERRCSALIKQAPFSRELVATIESIESGSVTIKFIGDDSSIPNVVCFPQYTPVLGDRVLVKISNNQNRSYNYFVIMKIA